jgi:Tol biopolymer transport system component
VQKKKDLSCKKMIPFKRNKLLVFLPLILLIATCDTTNEIEPEPKISGRLVYSLPDKNGKKQIYTSFTNGTGKKQLTHFRNDEAFEPVWSKDGTQIAFTTSLRSSSAGLSLYLMNADGSNIRPLKERRNSSIVTAGNNIAWSNDNSKIAFDWCLSCEAGGINRDIYVYDFVGDTIKKITSSTTYDSNPSWSNMNDDIAFSSTRADSLVFNLDVYVTKSDGSEAKRITSKGNAGRQLWFHNEDKLLYWWNNKLFVTPIDSGMSEQIDVNISSGLGFRPLTISSDDKYVLMLTFLLSTGQNFKLVIYDLQSGNLIEEFDTDQHYGADWNY